MQPKGLRRQPTGRKVWQHHGTVPAWSDVHAHGSTAAASILVPKTSPRVVGLRSLEGGAVVERQPSIPGERWMEDIASVCDGAVQHFISDVHPERLQGRFKDNRIESWDNIDAPAPRFVLPKSSKRPSTQFCAIAGCIEGLRLHVLSGCIRVVE
jgi:hypothetical protein